jgi:N-acetylmuramoyl-L-alanine amidase
MRSELLALWRHTTRSLQRFATGAQPRALIVLLAAVAISARGGRSQARSPGPLEVIVPEPGPDVPRNAWRYIVIHHSSTTRGNARSFGTMHRRKGWSSLAYHFVITNGRGGPDGHLEVGPRWWQQKHGAHAGRLHGEVLAEERNGYNEFGIGICVVGNLEHSPPTEKQLRTLVGLVAHLKKQFDIPLDNIFGHKHVRSTDCPGRNFPWYRLFARMHCDPPLHLGHQQRSATTDLCEWCLDHSTPDTTTASTQMGTVIPSTAGDLPPAPRLYHGQ